MSLNRIALGLFFALYVILPDYFALELSHGLPLLTASRCIILLLLLCLCMKKSINIHLDRSYVAYFCIMFCVFAFHCTTDFGEASKAIFTLLVEELALYVALKNLIKSKEQVLGGLRLMVKVSGIVSLLGIVESLLGVNLFYFLTTTSRDMLQASYDRLGMLRAEAGFGHPVYFAVYLSCMFPLALYFYEAMHKRKYLFIAIMNVVALFCTGSRSGIVVVAVTVLYILFKKKKNVKKKYLRIILSMVPVAILVCIVFPEIFDYASDLITSLLNSFGLTNASVDGFGNNAKGIESRVAQLTGLIWAKEHNALLMGFGPRAHMKGLISYINANSGRWNVINTIDIGYIGYMLLYGIVGTVAYLILYVSVARKAWKHSDEKDSTNIFNGFKLFYLAYFVSLTGSVGIDNLFFMITFLMWIYIDLQKKETLDETKN